MAFDEQFLRGYFGTADSGRATHRLSRLLLRLLSSWPNVSMSQPLYRSLPYRGWE